MGGFFVRVDILQMLCFEVYVYAHEKFLGTFSEVENNWS